jgi:hypothetical protein
MPLTSLTNVGILLSAPGHNVFSSFVGMSHAASPTHFLPTLITDEADGLKSDNAGEPTLSSTASLEGDDESNVNAVSTPSAPTPSTDGERPTVIPFGLDHDDPHADLVSQDDATSTPDSQAELLRCHHRLGNLPSANICLMPAKGEIAKHLATCGVPQCQSCLYG